MKLRIPATVGVLSVATLCTLTVPVTAHAASGDFHFRTQYGTEVVYVSPEDRCYGNVDIRGGIVNGTSSRAIVYSRLSCTGEARTVNVGQHADISGQSVRFLS